MKAETMADVVPIFITPTQSLLHNNNIGVTYKKTSNFRMEPLIFVPLYSMVMPRSMIIVIEVPFVSTLIHTIIGIRFRPQTPRGTKLVSLHENMPKELNRVFAS
jgi:hypothetical protein